MALSVRATRGGATCEVKVQPGASQTAVTGTWDGALKMKVTKKPEAGAANRECLRFLAKGLKLPANRLSILKGELTRRKVIRAEGLSSEDLKTRLEDLVSGAT